MKGGTELDLVRVKFSFFELVCEYIVNMFCSDLCELMTCKIVCIN